MSLFDAPAPSARRTDPRPAHEAAEKVRPGNRELITAIRKYVIEYGPSTAFEIADALEGRWAHDTIRSACARASLTTASGGLTPRGNNCLIYFVSADTVEVAGERL